MMRFKISRMANPFTPPPSKDRRRRGEEAGDNSGILKLNQNTQLLRNVISFREERRRKEGKRGKRIIMDP